MKPFIFIQYLFFLFVIFLFACLSEEDNNIEHNSVNLQNKKEEQKNLPVSENEYVEFIKGPCVCFFSMSDDEYNHFLINSNVNVKWEFDILFKKFKRETNNTISSLKQYDISTHYTTKPLIAFISQKEDTVFFKRKDEGYFIGQIFFSGKDSLLVEEGLMKSKQLEEKVNIFFKLKDRFKIRPVYEKIDTNISVKKDTIISITTDTIQP